MVNAANVYKVCDTPHPLIIQGVLLACLRQEVAKATGEMGAIWTSGYSALDIMTTVFKVLKGMDLPEGAKLELMQQVSATHMRVVDGVSTAIQMNGMCAKLAAIAKTKVLGPGLGIAAAAQPSGGGVAAAGAAAAR